MSVKAIQLQFNEILPEELRDYNHPLTKRAVASTLREVYLKYPDKYQDIIDKMTDLGRELSYIQGETLTLSDMKPTFDRASVFNRMDEELSYLNTIKNDKERNEKKLRIFSKYADIMGNMNSESARKSGSNLFLYTNSGARGNATQHRAMTTTPALYTDYKDRTIPLFIRKSFGDGLRPSEYMATAFGVRSAITSTKKSTAQFGDIAKIMGQSVSNMVISSEEDVSGNGIFLNKDDGSLVGRVLAREAAGYPPGTIIDREALARIRNSQDLKGVLVHSPLATISENGIPAQAFGASFDGGLPHIGWHAGFNASTNISEPLVQGSLSAKHTSGAFKGQKKEFTGYKYISQFLESPESFADRAPVANRSGTVTKIEEAPQGGSYIWVDDERHYVLPSFEIFVKEGDTIERGKQLSDGLVDPEDIIRTRGLGEGRKYYANRLKQILDDSGATANLRNVEVLARGALDHVRITDDDGLNGFLPGDIVSYNKLEARYTPPKDARVLPSSSKELTGKYLERPVLHYSIGTELLPSMVDEIRNAGFGEVLVSDQKPRFEPVMYRLREAPFRGKDDWLARMSSSYLQSNVIDSATRGLDTNISQNVNPHPRIFMKDFAKNIDKSGIF